MEKVSILIPTRQRYKKLAKCLSVLFENTVYLNYEVVVITDKDDPESIEVVKRLPFVEDENVKILVKEKREMYVGKINEGFHQTDSPLIAFLADDVEVNRNWLTEAVSTFHESFPDGMGLVSFQDEYDDRLAPHGFISRKYVEKYLKGNIFHPDYVHYWCDVELTVRSVGWGKFAHCPKSRIVHTRRAREEERDHICQEGLLTKSAGEKTFIQRICYDFPDVMPKMKEWKLPKKVQLKFKPTEMLEWYFGFGIDTEKKDTWLVDRETALYLLGGWPLNFSPIGLEQSKAWGRYGTMLEKTLEKEKKMELAIKNAQFVLANINKVDIILPTYNRPNLLERAIKSVLEQTSPNWELWIYDDGSICDNFSIVKRYEDERIHFFSGPKLTQTQREKRGGAIARNILLRKSNNNLISYLDDDNFYWPEAIEKIAEFFRVHPEIDVAFGKLTYSTPETESLPKERRKVRFFTEPVLDPFCKLDTSQVIHRRKCLQVGYWPEKTKQDLREDGFFFRQLAKHYTFYPVDIWFANFYEHKYSRHTLQLERNYITKRE